MPIEAIRAPANCPLGAYEPGFRDRKGADVFLVHEELSWGHDVTEDSVFMPSTD